MNAALLSSGQIAAVALGGIFVEALGPRLTLLVASAGTVAVSIIGLVAYGSLPAAVGSRSTRRLSTARSVRSSSQSIKEFGEFVGPVPPAFNVPQAFRPLADTIVFETV